uniref:DUF1995 domain-containing protein n=1 Tax=Octactis speculum TaxID=3111310 RepID=A0A7S2HIP4_9STRA|mmetsp:Transcript_6584/g.8141  ORF Transcript_6584/g.8141 Transcript_6584/m.8141 type:complete len:327 (+) Transcript_6584:3-983(+)
MMLLICVFAVLPTGRAWLHTSFRTPNRVGGLNTFRLQVPHVPYATKDSEEDLSTASALPLTASDMRSAAVDAIESAYSAGLSRQRIRVLLSSPRNPNQLLPPDETWEGGIMQLYRACSPLVRKIVQKISDTPERVARLTEQRLDKSGVDGESLWTSECASARNDVSAFVQPSSEQLGNIKAVCASAGPERLVMMVNPQYRDADDTLDYIASNGGGLFSAVAGFLGGKASFVNELDDLGFVSTFILEQYVIRGSELKYFLAYPSKWQIYITGDEGEPIFLGESTTRPDYNKIDDLLQENKIAVKAARDLKQAPKLTPESIKVLYDAL